MTMIFSVSTPKATDHTNSNDINPTWNMKIFNKLLNQYIQPQMIVVMIQLFIAENMLSSRETVLTLYLKIELRFSVRKNRI